MPVAVKCPSCRAKFKANDELAGKRLRCPKCASPIDIPSIEPADEHSWPPAAADPSGVRTTRPSSNASQVAVQPGAVAVPDIPRLDTRAVSSHAQTAHDAVQPHAAELLFPAIVTTQHGSKAGGPQTNAALARSRTKAAILFAAVGVGGLALVMAVATVYRPRVEPTAAAKAVPAATTKTSGVLVLQWPVPERVNAKLILDSQPLRIPAHGPFHISLAPGHHQVVIQRRGYEPTSSELELSAGQQVVFTPEWKVIELTPAALAVAESSHAGDAAAPAPDAAPAPPSASETATAPPQVSPETPGPVPRGFEGWTQSLPAAKQRAAAENKDVLLLFGSSDGSPKTLRLAQALAAGGLVKGLIADRYIAVVVDFPQTEAGNQYVLDRRQNQQLAVEYGITDITALPVMVLADAEGRPFAIQREWSAGLEQAAAKLPELAAQKAERDRLFQDAGQSERDNSLEHAASATKWLIDHHLSWSYRQEVQKWFELAVKADADNSAGCLEVFLAAEVFNRLAKLDPNDNVAVVQSLGILNDFLATKRFHDPDRGFRLHFVVGGILFECNDQEQALAHLKRAVTYEPKDRGTSQQAADLRRKLGNTNVLGNGTAFVVARGGYLLTNRHVVEGSGRLAVQVPGQEEPVEVNVVAVDDELDIALVKAPFADTFRPRPLPIAPADVRLSASVSAYGFPATGSLGESLKVTTGTVSALPTKTTSDMIVLDVKINPGNSGGPLCDKRGFVVGMVSAKTRGTAMLDSYGLAIKAKSLRDFLKANLPKGAPLAATTSKKGEAKDWADVTELVQESVFMLVKLRE